MTRFFFIFAVLLCASLVHADEVSVTLPEPPNDSDAQDRYTLSTLLGKTLKRSEWIAAFQYRVEESRFAALQASAWQNPEASFAGGRKQGQPEKGPLWEVALTQPVYFPGKQQLRGDIGMLGTDTARVRYLEAELSVRFDVVRLAYQYAILRKKKAILEDRQKRFELINSFLAGHLFSAPQQKAESHIVETKLNNLTTDALQIERAVQSALEQLNFYVAFQPGTLPDVEVPWLQGYASWDKAQWLEKAVKNNVTLSVQRLGVRTARKEKDLAGLEAWPDFTPTAFYERETAGDTERRVGLGLSLPLPILNRNENGVRSLEQKIQAEERLLRFNEQQLASQLGRFWAEYEAACLAVRRYPESLAKDLAPKLKEADEEFRKDRLQLLTFLELDDNVTSTYFRALDAQAALVDALLNILLLSGEKDVLAYLAGQ